LRRQRVKKLKTRQNEASLSEEEKASCEQLMQLFARR
jgi:hypothetical protein